MKLKRVPAARTRAKFLQLDSQLVGFWRKNSWEMEGSPLTQAAGFPKKTKFNTFVFDCVSPTLNTELKYACWKKFESGDWSVNTHMHSKLLRRIIEWLNHFHSDRVSLVEPEIATRAASLRNFLIRKGWFQSNTKPHLNKQMQIVRHTNADQHLCAFRQIIRTLDACYDDRREYDKDRWDMERMGISRTLHKPQTSLNFEPIS